MNRIRFSSFALLTALVAGTAVAGPLDPPVGPVTSTYKTLTEVEPRIAISATNTPGDSDSSPSVFKITQPGSYYLTSNVVGVSGKTGIEVTASNVTIDLNGFAIQGGTLGITASGMQGLTIRNGVVSGTTDTAVRAWNSIGARVESVTVRNAGGVGIDLGSSSIIDSCIVNAASLGVRVNSNSIVKNSVSSNCTNGGFDAQSTSGVAFESCTAASNGSHGIMMAISTSGRIDRCTISSNGDRGIYAGGNVVVTNCIVTSNAGHGISVSSHSVVTDNVCTGNGAGSNGSGISINGSCAVVKNNRVNTNVGYGIYAPSGTGSTVVMGNWAWGNGFGAFSVAAGNAMAPVITNPGSNNFSGATPFSNFAY